MLMSVSVFTFSYYDVIAASYEDKHRMQLDKIHGEHLVSHYLDIKGQQDAMMAAKHDMQKHLDAIVRMLERGDVSGASAYMASLELPFKESASLVFTPHVFVNIMLNECLRKAESLGVAVSCDISIPDSLAVSNPDLTVILRNVFDNALEALEPLDGDKRLSITLRQNDHFLFFEVANSFDPGADKPHTRNPQRGYGIKNIKACIDTYGGEFSVRQEGNTFISSAIINAPPPRTMP